MKRIILGFFLIFLLCYGEKLFADDNAILSSPTPQTVRVGISDNYFSNYMFDRVSITSDDDFVISDNSASEICLKGGEVANISFLNGEFEIYKDGQSILKSRNKLTIIPANRQNISIVGLKRKQKQASYSGNIELEISKNNPSSKFAIVNVVPLQTYLKGVVPNEMPAYFGLEALKAQAILARNYVLKPREKYYKEFDICDSVACQVYFGANTQEELSDKAVDETENIVVLYQNELILAVYSSTAGGYTESYKNVFMQNMNGRIMSPNVPYLIAVPDIKGMPKPDSEDKMREFYSSAPNTFDSKSPYFRWKTEWELGELNKILNKTLKTSKDSGFIKTKYPVDYSSNDFVGNIKSILINKRGESGKIVALTVITDKNEFTIYKELIIRKVFQYNNKILPSANAFFDFQKDENTKKDKLVATGGGLGHGVGMSQWGAGAMAKQGYKFNDIIHHYYTDVDISVLPILIPTNKTYTMEFYLESKKAILKFENKFHIKDLNIIINNRYIDTDLKKKLVKDGNIDISRYLKKGKNTVSYQITGDKNIGEVKFWIQPEE